MLYFQSHYVLSSLFPIFHSPTYLSTSASQVRLLYQNALNLLFRPNSGLLLSTKQPYSLISSGLSFGTSTGQGSRAEMSMVESSLAPKAGVQTTKGFISCHSPISLGCPPLQTAELPRALFLKSCFILQLKKCLFLNSDTFWNYYIKWKQIRFLAFEFLACYFLRFRDKKKHSWVFSEFSKLWYLKHTSSHLYIL